MVSSMPYASRNAQPNFILLKNCKVTVLRNQMQQLEPMELTGKLLPKKIQQKNVENHVSHLKHVMPSNIPNQPMERQRNASNGKRKLREMVLKKLIAMLKKYQTWKKLNIWQIVMLWDGALIHLLQAQENYTLLSQQKLLASYVFQLKM